MDVNLQREIEALIDKKFKGFSKRIGDTPTDALQLVNKKYVDAHVSGGTPGGANTQVQFNDSGVFGTDTNIQWVKSLKTLLFNSGTSNSSGVIQAANGNGLTFQAGNGITDPLGSDGEGIDMFAGDAGTTGDGNGGDINVNGGFGHGAGNPGNVKINGVNSLSTSANGGFMVIPHCHGAPTGTPAWNASVIYDLDNNNLYVYNSGWKSVTLT